MLFYTAFITTMKPKIMAKPFKPEGYNSLSPYVVADDAQKFIDLLKDIFQARELRRFNTPEGKVMHAEVQIDDSVLMIADSTEQWPANKNMLHVYVADAKKTYDLALKNGCEGLEVPTTRENDPDMRGAFADYLGNYWAIGTQAKN